jgi:hypothetical protein
VGQVQAFEVQNTSIQFIDTLMAEAFPFLQDNVNVALWL